MTNDRTQEDDAREPTAFDLVVDQAEAEVRRAKAIARIEAREQREKGRVRVSLYQKSKRALHA